MNSIILIGFMGVGKTSVGRFLAQEFALPFVDLDEQIQKNEQKKIVEIFASQGEAYFRALETEQLQKSSQTNQIIATGGGVVSVAVNREFLQQQQMVIQLRAQPQEIWRRLIRDQSRRDQSRPLLHHKNLAELTQLYQSRKSWYDQCSDVIIETDQLSVSEVATLLKKKLQEIQISESRPKN